MNAGTHVSVSARRATGRGGAARAVYRSGHAVVHAEHAVQAGQRQDLPYRPARRG
jgi:hypothetical protein